MITVLPSRTVFLPSLTVATVPPSLTVSPYRGETGRGGNGYGRDRLPRQRGWNNQQGAPPTPGITIIFGTPKRRGYFVYQGKAVSASAQTLINLL